MPFHVPEERKQRRRRKRDRAVRDKRYALRRERERRDERRKPRHHQDIENVTADDIPNGDVRFSFPRRHHRRDQFGQGRSHRHDRKPDDFLRYADLFRDRRRALHGKRSPADDQAKPDHRRQGQEPRKRFHLLVPSLEPFRRGLRFRLLGYHFVIVQRRHGTLLFTTAERVPDQRHGVRDKRGDHDPAFQTVDLVVERAEQNDERGRAEEHGEVDLQRVLLHGQSHKQRGKTENKQNVDNVTAQHVADGDADVALHRRDDGSRQFGRARTERDDGQTDDELGYTQFRGKPRRAVHEPVRAFYEQDESEDEKKYREYDMHRLCLHIMQKFQKNKDSRAKNAKIRRFAHKSCRLRSYLENKKFSVL